MTRKLFAFLLLLPASAGAQIIHGKITDAGTNAVIANVNVIVRDPAGRSMYSIVGDGDGEFEIPIPVGRAVRVQIDRIGYKAVTSNLFTLKRGELLEVDVHLAVLAVALDPVEVISKGRSDPRLEEFYQRALLNKRMGSGKIWTREDLDRHPVTRMSYLLYSVVNRPEFGCSGTDVYVDKLPIFLDPDEPQSMGSALDGLVSPDEVEGVEIYRDADIPLEYLRPHGTSGGEVGSMPCKVVLVWRKSYAEGAQEASLGMLLKGIGFIGFIFLSSALFWKL
jgi:hypothetical protein